MYICSRAMTWLMHVLMLLHTVTVHAKPNTDEHEGPCIGMECLHGVLMHGDEEQGKEHVAEDQYLRFKSQLDTDKPTIGPQDAETQLHGVLMHGDTETGRQHTEDVDKGSLPEQVPLAGPQDLNEMVHKGMHGDGGGHKHGTEEASEGDVNARKGPMDGEQMMHGMLMHGDANHQHDAEHDTGDGSEAEKGPIGPLDAASFMHGVLMHGDSEQGGEHGDHDHGKVPDSGSDGKLAPGQVIGPNSDGLHGILMHGDSSLGHDHAKEDAETKHEVFSDFSKIREIIKDESLLKMVDLAKLLNEDVKEYKDWVANSDEAGVPEGETKITVSDSILNDIQLMKQRYLSQTDDSVEDDPPRKDDPKNIPFTADDANAVLEGHVHADDGEGMEHNLELLGSTEPLNARHKVRLEMLKAKNNK